MFPRASGVPLPIPCLPSGFGIGDLGPYAYRFADYLHSTGQRVWQILPLNPTTPAYQHSPYHGASAFACNPLLISPEHLAAEGLLDRNELPAHELPEGRFAANGAPEIIIHDPYGAPGAGTGVLRNLCPRYGPTAARAIWRIIRYRILEGVRLAATLGTFARRMVAPGDPSIPVARQVDPQRLAEDAEPFIAADTDADVDMKFDPVAIRDGEPYMRTVDTADARGGPVHYGLYISPDAQPNRPQSDNYSLYIGTKETVRPARNITTVDTDGDMDMDVDVDGPGLPFDGYEELAEYASADARALFGTFYPTWTQKRREDEVLERQTGTGNRLNYRAGVRLLGAQPVSATGWAARSDGTDPDLFAGPRRYNAGDFGGRVELRSAVVPALVEYAVRTIEETRLQPTGDLRIRDEQVGTARAELRTRTLGLYGERLDLEDRLNGRDFTAYLGTFQHDLRWGWGSMLQSGVRYYDRTGFVPQRTAAWTEHARIQHVPGFATDLVYEQSRIEMPGLEQRLWSAAGAFIVEPGRFLRIVPGGEARWQRFTTGRRDQFRAIAQVTVSIPLARRVWFGARAMVGYEWQRLEPTADGTIRVVNEPHVVDATGRFSLFEPFADTSTIAVTSADETLLFERDVDYRAVATGDVVEVVLLPQGRIAVGDTVLVDYAYRLTPETRAQGLIASYGADLSIAGFTAYSKKHHHNNSACHGHFVFHEPASKIVQAPCPRRRTDPGRNGRACAAGIVLVPQES